MHEDRVILISGPTGTGKTGASILLAGELRTEIISADSMQVYRHMDIGTGKATPEERARVPHHMLDVAEPSEDFSAGRYMEMARPIIEGLHGRGLVPVVTGGTGLYMRAMTRGLFEGPDADWDLRRELLKEPREELLRRLAVLDPEAARQAGPGNARRLVRALEICIRSGRPASELRREGTRPLPYRFIKAALVRDREELYPMIEARVDRMMEQGLLEEVRRLMGMAPARTPMQAIGYRELAAHLRGELSLEEAVALIKRNTRRYAKRQMTWLRSEPDQFFVDITGLGSPEQVYGKLRSAISSLTGII